MSAVTVPLEITAQQPPEPVPIKNGTPVRVTGKLPAPAPSWSAAAMFCHAPNGATVWVDQINPVPTGATSFELTEVAGAPADSPEGANWLPGGLYTVIIYYYPAEHPGEAPIVFDGTFTYEG